MEPVISSVSVLKKFFLQSNDNLRKNVSQKLIDSNHMKSTAVDPHQRSVTVHDVNLINFSSVFNFTNKEMERQANTDQPIFKLDTFKRVIFGTKNVIRHHKSGDTSIITPWIVVTKDVDDVMKAGQLALPLEIEKNDLKCFIPCEGLNDDDEIPSWA